MTDAMRIKYIFQMNIGPPSESGLLRRPAASLRHAALVLVHRRVVLVVRLVDATIL